MTISTPAFPSSARIVIIGGGIVGCSTAYHLTRLGWRNIVLLDQGPLYQNWGSTSHAPGLIFQNNASRAVCQLARWTVETYREIAPRTREKAFNPVGSVEIATTPARAGELKRKFGTATAWGLECHLIDNRELARLIPILHTDDLHGAFYVPSDPQVKAAVLCEAMAQFCHEKGSLAVFERTPVTAIEKHQGRVRGVATERGVIAAEIVLCAAGVWGPAIGRLAGVSIPLTPMQHLYAHTEPLAALKGETEEVRHPIIRDQDKDMYYRQHGEAYGFGYYGHEPLTLDVSEIPRRDQATVLSFTPEHMADAFRYAAHRVPAVASARIAHSFNGVFSFTPDGQSILGESPTLRGFWVAEAVWVTHGGGVGRVMAEWLAHGLPGIDLREMDITRFHAHTASRDYILQRACRQYIEVYDILHPLDQPKTMRNLRVSPFHHRLEALGATFFESGGWERPQWFAKNEALLAGSNPPVRDEWSGRNWSPVIAAEHRACRERVGLFDLTAFAKFEITGPRALEVLQSLTANDVDQSIGKVIYTAMLDERGGIKCDLTITRLDADRFWVVTGGRMGLHDLAWIRNHCPDDGSVHITDFTSAYACIGLWGPRAREVLSRVCEDDVGNEAFPYLTGRPLQVASVPVLAVRISYAGELGWELYAPFEYSLALWDALWTAGQPFGIAAVGYGAFDSLRLEKGYRAWGTDIHTDYNPYEAGLGFAVRLGKGDFIGRAALAALKEKQAVARKLCCLVMADPSVVLMGKEPILSADGVEGYVTSANTGYSVGQSIAYGYLPVAQSREGTRLEILSFGRRHAATVKREPLYDPTNAKLKS